MSKAVSSSSYNVRNRIAGTSLDGDCERVNLRPPERRLCATTEERPEQSIWDGCESMVPKRCIPPPVRRWLCG